VNVVWCLVCEGFFASGKRLSPISSGTGFKRCLVVNWGTVKGRSNTREDCLLSLLTSFPKSFSYECCSFAHD
jgi:hypothetical protein